MSAPLCLLTRPEAQSRAFAAELPGIKALIAPILRIEPVDFDRARLQSAPGFVFTSANAVPFAGAAQGRPALCVGTQTAEAARAAGFQVTQGPGDALGLLPLLEGRADWLHLHGLHRARELPVPGMAVYDQVAQPLSDAARNALSQPQPIILPLFSPRSARLLGPPLAGAQASIATVAISAAADAAYDGPANLRRVAAAPERAAMRAAILSLVGTERSSMGWVETERSAR